jgi:hypothetical protein
MTFLVSKVDKSTFIKLEQWKNKELILVTFLVSTDDKFILTSLEQL